MELGEELGLSEMAFEDLCKDQKIIDKIMKIMDASAKKAKIFGFEKVRKLYIHPKSFEDCDLLTTTFKLKRNIAKNYFKDVINKLYGIEQQMDS